MLRELKTFIAVTRYGTFAAAGLGELTFYREIVLLQRYSQRTQPIQQLFARCLTQIT